MSARPQQWLHQMDMDTKASANDHFDFDSDFQLMGCGMDSDLGLSLDRSPSSQFFSPTTESADATLAPSLYDFESMFGSFEHCGDQLGNMSGTSNAAIPSLQTLGDSFESSSTSPQSTSDFTSPSCDNTYWSQSETSLDVEEQAFRQLTSAIRQLVHAKADASPSGASNKEKRRDAAISLHLQLLKDAPVKDTYLMSDASTPGHTFDPCSEFLSCSDPSMSGENSLNTDSLGCMKSPSTPSSSLSVAKVGARRTASRSAHGGVELVLDLNMNETTSGPKKQKPRTQAQRESYINARRNGACEKHRKQHKRCHCFDNVPACISSIKKTRAQEKPSSIQQVIQERDSIKALQFIQATHEALEQEVSAAAKSVDTLLPRTEIYTCLCPGCTFTSHTVGSLQKHYHFRHSFVSSPTLSPTGDMQTPAWSHALHIPWSSESSGSESVFSDTIAESVSASVHAHAQGDEPQRHTGVPPHAPRAPRRPRTTDLSKSGGITWICALPLEMTAAEAMLDETHDRLPQTTPASYTYILEQQQEQQKSECGSSYSRRVSNNRSGGEAEIYDSQQQIWRDTQQSPVSLASPAEHITEQDSSKICGFSGLASLLQGNAGTVCRTIIAISFSWFCMAAISLLRNFYCASATISRRQQHHIRGLRLEVVI